VDEAAVHAALMRAAAPFAGPAPAEDDAAGGTDTGAPAGAGRAAQAGAPAEPVWSRLWDALVPGDESVYGQAIEYVYEGYLLHYRESRVLASDATVDRRLLLGDRFDALGLRLVTDAGDIDAVRLLTRLMAACSWMRVAGCPFAYDDDLWALTVAGMASAYQGGNAYAALAVFDEVDRLIARERIERLPAVVRRGAAGLWLRHPGPLRAALGLDPPAGGDDPVDPVEALHDADAVEPHEAEIVAAEEQFNDQGGVW
jgi:hypothetical protein